MISIIIPALNEERYIEKLLIRLNGFDDIIVVDGNSDDNTRKVAQKYAKVITSKKRNTSYQRNFGAMYAKYDWLLFLDADISPSQDFLDKIVNLIQTNKIIAGSALVKVNPDEQRFSDRLFCGFLNSLSILMPRTMVRGAALLIRKDVFQKTRFNENAAVAEDVDLAHRINKLGPTSILPWFVYESARRYRKQGHLPILFKWCYNGIAVKLTNKSIDKEWRPVR